MERRRDEEMKRWRERGCECEIQMLFDLGKKEREEKGFKHFGVQEASCLCKVGAEEFFGNARESKKRLHGTENHVRTQSVRERRLAPDLIEESDDIEMILKVLADSFKLFHL